MIVLETVSDVPRVGRHRIPLFERLSVTLPRARYALLSPEPGLRRHALDVLSGVRPPRRGRVHRQGRGSWIIGRPGFIRGKVTGLHVVDLVARIYGLDVRMCRRVVEELLAGTDMLDESIEHWSGPMRLEFGHALALLPSVDQYFVEGVFPSPKGRFGQLWSPLFRERSRNRMLVLSSTRESEIKQYCEVALIVEQGRLEIRDDLEAALDAYPPRPLGEDDRPGRTAGIELGAGADLPL